MSTILLAGGAGYIGSHTAVELLNAGYEVVVADNFSNSSPEAIRRVEKITGKQLSFMSLISRITQSSLKYSRRIKSMLSSILLDLKQSGSLFRSR